MAIKTFDPAALEQFRGGTDHWYSHLMYSNITYTDGVMYVMKSANAEWLIDEIARYTSKMFGRTFLEWKLVREDNSKPISSATLTCDDGDGNYLKTIKYTHNDGPAAEITFWCERRKSGFVILLPTEH